MRVCMVNDNFYRGSGAAVAIRRIAQALTDTDYCVASCSGEPFCEDLSWIPTGEHERFDLKSSNPLQVISEMVRFRKWFESRQCDLAHCHHRRMAALLQLAGVRVLYTGHLVFPNAMWFRWLRPRQMTAVSSSVAENLLQTTGRRTLDCISNPVEFPASPPRVPLETVRSRAVCVARLEPVKGHKYLLSAWKILRDKGYRYALDIVGDGSRQRELMQQSRDEGTSDLIRFHGFVSNVSRIVEDSLFAVLVSEIEGQGIVTLEAASMGRPTLLSAVPGSIDVLPPQRHLQNGLKFGDVDQLAEALEQWFSSPGEVIEEGQRFFMYLKSLCDPMKVARSYEDVYRRIVCALPAP
jgi:glycosyltransferase involved in cell wall biosynthesis